MVGRTKSLKRIPLQFSIIIGALYILSACSQPQPTTTQDIAANTEAENSPDTTLPTDGIAPSAQAISTVTSGSSEGEAVENAVVSPDKKAAVAAAPTRRPASAYSDLEIVTLLPRDAIPAIDKPRFLSTAEADEFYDPDELVIGVSFDGDARAYSVPFLSNHEIVNDTVGGVKIAVTW